MKVQVRFAVVCLLLWVWMLALPNLAWAGGLQVSPTRFEFNLERKFNNFFTLANTGDKPLHIKIYPSLVMMGKNNTLVEIQNSPFDLSSYLVFSPRSVTLQPGQRRIIRFTVRPPDNLAAGEYRTVVFFEELPGPDEAPRFTKGKKLGVDLTLLTRIGVPLYGMMGAKTQEVIFEKGAAERQKGTLSVGGRFVNKGNAHVQIDVDARLLGPGDKLVAQKLEKLFLQRDQKQDWAMEAPVNAGGNYQLVIKAKAGDALLVDQTYPYNLER